MFLDASMIATSRLPMQMDPKDVVTERTNESLTPWEQHDDASVGANLQAVFTMHELCSVKHNVMQLYNSPPRAHRTGHRHVHHVLDHLECPVVRHQQHED